MRWGWVVLLTMPMAVVGCAQGTGTGSARSPSPSPTSPPSRSPSGAVTPPAVVTSPPSVSASPTPVRRATLRPSQAVATASPRRTPRRTPTSTPTFSATRRGRDEGPAYHAVFVGQNYGGDGKYNVFAACRSGTVRVTVHDNGMSGPASDDTYPFGLSVYADDQGPALFQGRVNDGQVITGRVKARVRILTTGINEDEFKIEYDCR